MQLIGREISYNSERLSASFSGLLGRVFRGQIVTMFEDLRPSQVPDAHPHFLAGPPWEL